MPEWLKKPVPFVVDVLPIFRNYGVKTVLDLGCGVGRHCIYLATRGFNVVGIDASRSALKIAGTWSRMERIRNVTFLCASMIDLSFVDRRFGAVISVSVIHHAKRKEITRTIKEIYRVLKDNGLFLANLLSTDDYRYGLGQKVEEGTFLISEEFEEKCFKEIHHFFTKNEVIGLLAAFREIRTESIQSGKKERPHRYWKITAIK